MNSRDKWEQLEEDKRFKAIAQNGNNGEHYENNEQLEFNFWEEQEPVVALYEAADVFNRELFIGDVAYPHQIGTFTNAIGSPKTYELNVDKIKTVEDIKLVLGSMNLCITSFGQLDEKQQNLIDREIFTLQQ